MEGLSVAVMVAAISMAAVLLYLIAHLPADWD